MRVAQGNHLVGAGNRRQVRRQRGRLRIQQQHRIKTHGCGNLARQGEGARGPQRKQGTRHDRGVSQQLLEHELVAAQLALQVRRLVVYGFNALGPHTRSLRQQTRRGAGHMGVVGTAETGLRIAQAVAVQQLTLVMLQQELQGRLPPGKLQLSGNNLGRNLTRIQVIEQLRQAALTQLLGQSVTLRQGHEQHAVRHEGVQARIQSIQVGAHEVGTLDGVSQDNAQTRQLRHQGVQGGSQLIQVLRNLRGAGRLNVANPLGTLSLNNLQLLVQVTDIHAGQDVLLRRAAQAGTLHTAHLDAVLTAPRTGCSRSNQVGHRAVVDIRAETLERLADAHQNRQLRLPLRDGAAAAQTQHGAGLVHRFTQVQQGGLEGNDQGVRLGGFLVIDQAGTVPRGGTRCRRKTVNLAQAHQLGAHLLTLHERVEHGAVKTHAGCRAVLGGGQLSQTL